MQEAIALLRAARMKVILDPGFFLLSLLTSMRSNVSWNRNVSAGLSVNNKVAEYPD